MADSFIALANQHAKEAGHGKTSATFLYAAARFNIFLAASESQSRGDFSNRKDELFDYFISEYRKMLEEHYTDYEQQYDSYIQK